MIAERGLCLPLLIDNRTLILPLFGGDGKSFPDKPIGWYFNISRIKDFVPVMEWNQFNEEFLSDEEQAVLKKKAEVEGTELSGIICSETVCCKDWFGVKNRGGQHDNDTEPDDGKIIKAVKIKVLHKGQPALPDNGYFHHHHIRMWRER